MAFIADGLQRCCFTKQALQATIVRDLRDARDHNVRHGLSTMALLIRQVGDKYFGFVFFIGHFVGKGVIKRRCPFIRPLYLGSKGYFFNGVIYGY